MVAEIVWLYHELIISDQYPNFNSILFKLCTSIVKSTELTKF